VSGGLQDSAALNLDKESNYSWTGNRVGHETLPDEVAKENLPATFGNQTPVIQSSANRFSIEL
jgi:hypothetical protein